MKCWPVVAAALLLTACGDVTNESYATYAEARAAGMIERGWLPDFVPTSATDIHDVHDLDTNAQTLIFSAPTSEVPATTARFRRAPAEDLAIARQMIAHLGWEPDALGASVQAYQLCRADVPGGLFVNNETGVIAYKVPVDWTTFTCPS
ncbi:MAG: hypothetical protein V7678_05545 [Brevundimonas sp.]